MLMPLRLQGRVPLVLLLPQLVWMSVAASALQIYKTPGLAFQRVS